MIIRVAHLLQVKGLVDPENISQNADYDQHLPSSASPPIPPSENDIDRKRPHIEHRNSLIAERFDEHESDSMHRDFDLANENDNRTELSPILNEHIRKRRKDSICDNPLPHKRLHLRTPESNVSYHTPKCVACAHCLASLSFRHPRIVVIKLVHCQSQIRMTSMRRESGSHQMPINYCSLVLNKRSRRMSQARHKCIYQRRPTCTR
jgi:hypothetical protein